MSKKVGQATQKAKTKKKKKKNPNIIWCSVNLEAYSTWFMSDKFLCYLISNPVDEGANVSSETTYLIGRE